MLLLYKLSNKTSYGSNAATDFESKWISKLTQFGALLFNNVAYRLAYFTNLHNSPLLAEY